MSPVPRKVVATLLGAIAYTATLWRFLSYTERNRLPITTYQTFALALFAIGFAVALGAGKSRYRTAACAILGAFLVHATVIALDWRLDPTDHNLFPFEFLILAFAATPVFLGAALAHFGDSARKRLQ